MPESNVPAPSQPRREPSGRIVIVCGGRDFTDRERLCTALDEEHARSPIRLLIEGGADGADDLAFGWAKERGVPWITLEAEWDKYGRSAGPIRNAEMLFAKPDDVIAFPGGAGTADMVRQATEAGVNVILK